MFKKILRLGFAYMVIFAALTCYTVYLQKSGPVTHLVLDLLFPIFAITVTSIALDSKL